MTREEKAKAYDEALEDMRVIYPNLKGDAKLAVEHAFPELKESEDERIRKEIYNFLIDMEYKKEWIAYLEKQKEQKPFQTDDEKEYIRTIKSIISDFIRDKKPEDVTYYQQIYNWLDGRHIEQKPEWSEEEKDKVVRYLHDKDGGMLWSKATEITEDILGMIRPLPHWKPSEEQMRVFLKANPVNLMPEELPVYKSLCNDIQKLM